MKDINVWMTEHKYADNVFAASHIFAGLQLSRVPRFWQRVKLVMLYRLHRDSGEPSKFAYTKALTGVRPLMLELTATAQESEAE